MHQAAPQPGACAQLVRAYRLTNHSLEKSESESANEHVEKFSLAETQWKFLQWTQV